MKKKTICAVLMLTFGINTNILASTHPEIQLLKDIYGLGAKIQKGDELLALYYDEDLERAQNHLDHGRWENCKQAWYDKMWQGNDPEYRQKPSFQKIGQNTVKVTLAPLGFYEKAQVSYRVQCKKDQCKISDIIDDNGSFKKALINQCH